jgi:phosphatidylinositol kinase/protein kinase (PI-3  family)
MFADSTLPCFMVYGEQSANQLRDRFQPTLTHAFIGDHINKLIDSSLGSHWTRLYDSVRSTSSWVQTYSNMEQYQYYSQSIL